MELLFGSMRASRIVGVGRKSCCDGSRYGLVDGQILPYLEAAMTFDDGPHQPVSAIIIQHVGPMSSVWQ